MSDTPLARLKAFRASWNDDDVIDDESKLSAGDLDEAIRALEQAGKVVAIKSIDLRDLNTLRD